MKRWLDRIISQGTGKQLYLLTLLCSILFSALFALAYAVYGDMSWQETVALFMDAGCFGGDEGHHDLFRLLIALVGMFTLNALLVSVFSNIIDNISEKWTNGEVRYRHRNHILIIGAHRHLFNMLHDLSVVGERDIVILTDCDVEELRKEMRQLGLSAHLLNRITLYRGRRINKRDLMDAYPQLAHIIYVLGEDGEDNHDSLSIRCVNMLYELCLGMETRIPAYVMLTDDATTEVMARSASNTNQESLLCVDYINCMIMKLNSFLLMMIRVILCQ